MGRPRGSRNARREDTEAHDDDEKDAVATGDDSENDAPTDADQAKPPKKRGKKPAKRSEDDTDDEETPKKRGARSAKNVEKPTKDDTDGEEYNPQTESPKKRGAKTTKRAGKSTEDDTDDEGDNEEIKEPPKKRGAKTTKRAGKSTEDDTDDEADNEEIKEPPKKRGAKSTKQVEKSTKDDSDKSDDEEYEVEKILDSKKVKGQVHFLIRWKGYQSESDTWEPESTLACPDLITKFKENQVNGKSEKSTKRKSVQKSRKTKKQKSESPKKNLKSDFDYENAKEDEEYEVEKILEVHFKKNGKREFLIHWKGWTSKHDSWEPEDNLNCSDLIKNFLAKVDKKKSVTPRDLRVARSSTKRFTLTPSYKGRRLSKRGSNVQRVRYDDAE